MLQNNLISFTHLFFIDEMIVNSLLAGMIPSCNECWKKYKKQSVETKWPEVITTIDQKIKRLGPKEKPFTTLIITIVILTFFV